MLILWVFLSSLFIPLGKLFRIIVLGIKEYIDYDDPIDKE